jgi:hypothetical protein
MTCLRGGGRGGRSRRSSGGEWAASKRRRLRVRACGLNVACARPSSETDGDDGGDHGAKGGMAVGTSARFSALQNAAAIYSGSCSRCCRWRCCSAESSGKSTPRAKKLKAEAPFSLNSIYQKSVQSAKSKFKRGSHRSQLSTATTETKSYGMSMKIRGTCHTGLE